MSPGAPVGFFTLERWPLGRETVSSFRPVPVRPGRRGRACCWRLWLRDSRENPSLPSRIGLPVPLRRGCACFSLGCYQAPRPPPTQGDNCFAATTVPSPDSMLFSLDPHEICFIRACKCLPRASCPCTCPPLPVVAGRKWNELEASLGDTVSHFFLCSQET